MIHRMQCRETRWRTPLEMAQEVRNVFGGAIGLDPCTEPCNHLRAQRFYTEASNGLILPWDDRTWCNPPFGRELASWMAKACAEAVEGYRIGLLISVARTEMDYFQETLLESDRVSCVQFLKGKVAFSEGKDTGMLASWVWWFNVDPGVVKKFMGHRGKVKVLS